MLVLKNIQKIDGSICSLALNSPLEEEVNAKGLTLLPAAIDPHVHFRTPGAEYKEDWISGARAALQGGVSTVFDMPNNSPSCTTLEALQKKRQHIQQQLEAAGIPLRYHLYFGADKANIKEIAKARNLAIGIKVFMGSSTGDLLIDDDDCLEEIFKTAADLDMLVSVHAEDEAVIKRNQSLFGGGDEPALHSKIRSPEAAKLAVEKALSLAQRYNVRLCILHVSTRDELHLIRQAKDAGVQVFAEASPHHLLLTASAYGQWGARVQVNPPLREEADREALCGAIRNGTIDFIGSDHAPHTLEEKKRPYGKAPSGIPSVDLFLPLLLNCVNEGKLSLDELIKLTSANIAKIFRLEPANDYVLVDLTLQREVTDHELQTKSAWSPYSGRFLTGWPLYTVVKGIIFKRIMNAHAHRKHNAG